MLMTYRVEFLPARSYLRNSAKARFWRSQVAIEIERARLGPKNGGPGSRVEQRQHCCGFLNAFKSFAGI